MKNVLNSLKELKLTDDTKANIIGTGIVEGLRKYRLNYGIVLIILVNLLFIHFGVASGKSMNPSIYDGDLLFSYRHATMKRGDIVVLKVDIETMAKRIIGVEGDIIEFKDKEVYLNGELLEENYIMGETTFNFYEPDKIIEVPEGSYFVMGDNRENSGDSRQLGSFSKNEMRGRVFIKIPIAKIFNFTKKGLRLGS